MPIPTRLYASVGTRQQKVLKECSCEPVFRKCIICVGSLGLSEYLTNLERQVQQGRQAVAATFSSFLINIHPTHPSPPPFPVLPEITPFSPKAQHSPDLPLPQPLLPNRPQLHVFSSDVSPLRPEKFEIQFDAPGAVYFSTQTITGNVVLKVTEPINLKGKTTVEVFCFHSAFPLAITNRDHQSLQPHQGKANAIPHVILVSCIFSVPESSKLSQAHHILG